MNKNPDASEPEYRLPPPRKFKPNSSGLGSKRLLIEAAFRDNPHAFGVTLARKFGVSQSYISGIREGMGYGRRNQDTNRSKIKLPDGLSVSDHVRTGFALEETMTATAVADALKLGDLTYRRARTIVLLSDRTDLAQADHTLAQDALRLMNKDCRTIAAYKLVQPLIKRIWGVRAPRDSKSEARRREAFRKALTVLTQVCETASQVEVPYIDPKEFAAISAQLKECRANLTRLWRRVAVQPPSDGGCKP